MSKTKVSEVNGINVRKSSEVSLRECSLGRRPVPRGRGK